MTTAYNFPDLDISPIDQDVSTASGLTVNASEILNIDSSISIEITPPPEKFALFNRSNEENDENSHLARIDEEISDFGSIFEFPLDSPSRRGVPTTEDEGNYSSEEVFQRLEKDARKILCASHSIEEDEIGMQDGNCMSNTILRGITAYVDFQCCMESAKTVKSKLRQMGAVVQRRMSATVSHVVFSRGGRKSTLQTVLSLDPRPYLVDPHWVHSCYFNQFRAPEESYSLYGCKYLVNSLRRASLDPEAPEPVEDSLNQIELTPEDDLAPGKKTTVPLPRSNSTVSLSESAELTFDQPMTATQLLTKIDALSKKLDRLAADDTAALAHGKRCPSRQSIGEENIPVKTIGTSTNQLQVKQTLPLRRRTHGAFGLNHRLPYSAAVKEMAAFREATEAENGILDITNRLNTVALGPVQKKINGIDDMRRTQSKNLNQIHKTLQNNSKYRRKKVPVKAAPELPAIFENLDETEESLLRTPRVPLARPVVNTASGIINRLQNVPSSDEFASGGISRVKKRGIIFTGFNRDEEILLNEAASFLELRVQTKIDQGEKTRQKSHRTRCVISHQGQRTLATLKAVCMGIPVVKPEWLQTCEKEDKLVGLRHFAYPQWQRVLQPAKSMLFRRLGPILVVEGCSPPSEDLKWMIRKCGGEKILPLGADERTIAKCIEDSLNSGRLNRGKEKILRFIDKINAPVPQNQAVLEILRLFNENPDFYYCEGRDLTLSVQSFFSGKETNLEFFWNYHNLSFLRDISLPDEDRKLWQIPIIQGFVRSVELSLVEDSQLPTSMNLTLISRRSVKRAGTRYLRRGIDTDSNVANFVESELILNIFDHHLSFVQVRGSVPVFWSQRGYKYRPPLAIDRPLEESMPYFEKHMSCLAAEYGTPLIAINLVDLTGRELSLAKSYIEHAVKHNSENLTFVSFDLHHHCRGLRFDQISTLITAVESELNGIGFCWVDKTGEVVRRQNGIVRTNCVDCLDRTNVVQGSISQYVCMRQAQRLGIFGPLCEPPEALVNILQTLWADNGDSISTQYAGTAALKGDVTRSGERKLAGIVRDGYNSASRYYLSHMKDTVRQKAINLFLGVPDQGTETMAVVEAEDEAEEDESVSRLVNETIHFLLPENEVVVGGWGLVDAQIGGDNVDSILLLTKKCLHVATYDDDTQKLIDVRMVPLMEVEKVELGQYSRSSPVCLRIQQKSDQQAIILHPAKTRLFNNVALRLKSQEEADEYIESIAEQIRITFETNTGRPLNLATGAKISVNRQNTAKKAFATMTSALKIALKKTPAPPLKRQDSPDDSGTCTPVPEDSPPMDPHHFSDDTAVDQQQKMAVPAEVRSSSSEGRLMDKSSANLVSRLKGLPFMKGVIRSDPFESYSSQINESHTKFIML